MSSDLRIVASEMAVVAAERPEAAAVLAKATLEAAARLGVSRRELARVLGLSEATLSRASRGRGLDPEDKPGELAALFLRLYRSLDALVGGDDRAAAAWLHGDNAHLRGVPAERIRTVEGLVDVIHYLDAMRGRV